MREEETNDQITSYIKLINDLSGEVKLISTKGLAKELISGYSILNGAKYFSREDGLQNYDVFEPVLRYLKPLTNDIGEKPKLCQVKVLNLLPHQIILLIHH